MIQSRSRSTPLRNRGVGSDLDLDRITLDHFGSLQSIMLPASAHNTTHTHNTHTTTHNYINAADHTQTDRIPDTKQHTITATKTHAIRRRIGPLTVLDARHATGRRDSRSEANRVSNCPLLCANWSVPNAPQMRS